MPVSIELVRQLEIFSTLPDQELARFLPALSERSAARREVLLHKDAPAPWLGFLIKGRLQGVDFTADEREVGLYFVEQGEYFGELSVIDGLPQPEFVIATAPSHIVTLPHAEAHELLFATPAAARQVSNGLASRVRAATAQRSVLALPNPFQRLCVHLDRLAVDNGQGGAVIPFAPTHQELAIMINSTRETVTRSFQVLQRNGTLARDGNQLKIADLNYIREIAEGRAPPPKVG